MSILESDVLVSLLSGIGGAASAGLNAYLPLLIIALADRSSASFNLDSPYDRHRNAMGNRRPPAAPADRTGCRQDSQARSCQ